MRVNEDYEAWNAAAQIQDENSVHNFWKAALRVRKENSVLVRFDYILTGGSILLPRYIWVDLRRLY